MPKLARGILPALCTPFDDSGQQLETTRVKAVTDHLLAAGTTGLFICGGSGEGGAMTAGERRRMTECVVAEAAGAVPVIIQVGATGTDEAVELARHAETAGADATASVAPVDQPNDLAAATAHYAAIGAASNLPFYVYWLQRQADQTISPAQFLEAMATVPNFAGLKFTDTNFFFFQQLIDLSGGAINAITGPDEMCLSGMVMGSDGSIGTTYNLMPKLFVQMRSDFEAGRIEAAMQAQQQINRVIAALIRAGVLPAVKALLSSRGLPVGPTRPPFTPLNEATTASLRAELDALDFDVE